MKIYPRKNGLFKNNVCIIYILYSIMLVVLVYEQYVIFSLKTDNWLANDENHENPLVQILT